MSRTTIAPTLREDVKRRRMGETGRCRAGAGCDRCKRGAAELRSLLQLDHVVRLGHLCPSRGECRICRALARVTKVSAGSRGKR
jgi:hypothetical protein